MGTPAAQAENQGEQKSHHSCRDRPGQRKQQGGWGGGGSFGGGGFGGGGGGFGGGGASGGW